MYLNVSVPEHVHFICNICETANHLPLEAFGREQAWCVGCGSTSRMRGMVYALSLVMHGSPLSLPRFPPVPHLRGMGCSDWDGYAVPLARTCSFTNTFLHQEPFFDLMRGPEERAGFYDFVTCTDVLEHVPPPVQSAFDSLAGLVKPGGALIMSVPSFVGGGTHEHFPNAHLYKIIEFHGERLLVNRAIDGRLEVFDGLVFHGGDGDTLEMRLFGANDVREHLAVAGFSCIQELDAAVLDIGFYWPRQHWPILAEPIDSHIMIAWR